jgi:hypothetical protein
MKREMAIVDLLVIISGIAIFLLGCAHRVVMVRSPESRMEGYGEPPYPDTIWIAGYWQHTRGELMCLISGYGKEICMLNLKYYKETKAKVANKRVLIFNFLLFTVYCLLFTANSSPKSRYRKLSLRTK